MVYSTPFAPPGKYVADSEGKVPPSFGGPLAVARGTFDFEDTTAKTLFTLPAGAVPVDWFIDVSEDFDAGTNNNLDVGIVGDADYFAADLAIGTQGLFRNGAASTVRGRVGVQFKQHTGVTVIYKPSGTAPTQGSGTLVLFYSMETV